MRKAVWRAVFGLAIVVVPGCAHLDRNTQALTTDIDGTYILHLDRNAYTTGGLINALLIHDNAGDHQNCVLTLKRVAADELAIGYVGDGIRFSDRRRYTVIGDEIVLSRIFEVWALPLVGASIKSYRMGLGRGADGRLRMRVAGDWTLFRKTERTLWLERCDWPEITAAGSAPPEAGPRLPPTAGGGSAP